MSASHIGCRPGLVDEDEASHLTGSSFTVADAYLFSVLGWIPGFSTDLGR
jgi:hypothetical protein